MSSLNQGDTLFVPVEVGSGAFVGERLISFDTLEGPVSGFIREDQIIKRGNASFVQAQILELESNRIAIKLHGSFFTTTGLAHISRESHFEKAA